MDEEIKLLRDLDKNLKKKFKGKSELTTKQIRRLKFAALVNTKRDKLNLTQKQLADKAGVDKSVIRQIERGDNALEKNRELLRKISRALKIDFVSACKRFGLEIDSQIKTMDLATAKSDFIYALEKSKSYRDFFIRVFRIAEAYKLPFRSKNNDEFDKNGDEVEIMGKVEEFERVEYSDFFLSLIYKFASESSDQKRKAAKTFFNSELVKSLDKNDWEAVFKKTDKKVLEDIYTELNELYEKGKIEMKSKES